MPWFGVQIGLSTVKLIWTVSTTASMWLHACESWYMNPPDKRTISLGHHDLGLILEAANNRLDEFRERAKLAKSQGLWLDSRPFLEEKLPSFNAPGARRGSIFPKSLVLSATIMSFFQLLAILISFALHVVSSDNKNYFISPASNDGINPVLTLGETTVISWKTTLDVFNVTIWQQSLVEQGASSQGNIYCMHYQNERMHQDQQLIFSSQNPRRWPGV